MTRRGDVAYGSVGESCTGRPVVQPIVQTVTFQAASLLEQQALVGGETFYSRHGNPTVAHAERVIAELEGGVQAVAFASGMAAITATLLSVLRAGDHLVAQEQVYGATFDFMRRWLTRLGVEVTLVDARSPEQFAQSIRENTRAIYVESPANPTLGLVDLQHVAALARDNGLVSIVDNTFASPINQRPLAFGIDVVIHAATKYLSGHSDILAGAVITNEVLAEKLRETRICLGGILDPHAAWLLIRGLKTLALRVARQNESALRIAEFLSQDRRVRRVYYPFHSTHPQYDLAHAQMCGGGGVLSFELKGDLDSTRIFVEGLRRFALAPSLGGVESLVTVPAYSSHTAMSVEERMRAGISDQLVRLAVGVEAVDGLIADLSESLERCPEGSET